MVAPVKIGLVMSEAQDDKRYLESIIKGLILMVHNNKIVIINILQSEKNALVPDQDIYLYGISPDFVIDPECVNLAKTFPLIKNTARHTPILFRPIDGWRNGLTVLSKWQALPYSQKTEVDKYMSQYSRLDSAAEEVTKGIRLSVEKILAGGN